MDSQKEWSVFVVGNEQVLRLAVVKAARLNSTENPLDYMLERERCTITYSSIHNKKVHVKGSFKFREVLLPTQNKGVNEHQRTSLLIKNTNVTKAGIRPFTLMSRGFSVPVVMTYTGRG